MATSPQQGVTPAGLTGLALLIFLAAALIGNAANTQQPAPTTTTSTTTTTAPSTVCVAPPVTQVAAGLTGPVQKIPVAKLATAPRSCDYARRIGVPNHGVVLTLGLSTTLGEYTTPIYAGNPAVASAGTFPIRMFRNNSLGGGWVGYTNGQYVNWSNSWKPAAGNDAFEIITDPLTGISSEFYHASWPGYSTATNNSGGCINLTNLFAGFDINRDLCVVSAIQIQNPATGLPVNVYTSTSNSPVSSGGGVPNEQYVIKAAEITRGRIDHAIGIFVENTGYGAECSAADYLNPTRFMVTCSGAIAPSGQFEGKDRSAPVGGDGSIKYPITDQLPEGLLVSLVMTDAEIEQYLDAHGLTGIDRATAKIILVGGREFGFRIKDTNGPYGGIIIQTDGAPEWRSKVTGDGRNILGNDLFQKPSRLRFFKPPTNSCTDGRQTIAQCPAGTIFYKAA